MKTPSRDELFQEVRQTLHDLFEIELERIVPEAQLYQDLDLDSIDAVDLVVRLQARTGKKLKPEEFRNVRSVNDVVGAVESLFRSPQERGGPV